MVDIHTAERDRVQLQAQLDQRKTQTERNKLGQFATPSALASSILECSRRLIPNSPIRFLDPAFGTGAFYSALLRAFPPGRIAQAVGFEIDPHYGVDTLELWEDSPLKLRITDFTRTTPPFSDEEKANLLVCNPPYVRHHHIEAEQKAYLRRRVKETAGVTLSGLAGFYCYFLCLAHSWMADNGLAAWLIPGEFMDVNYGKEVKQYLLTRVTLLRIHRFDPLDVQFDDALVSSVVVWFRNAPPPPDHSVSFTSGGTLMTPEIQAEIPVSQLRNGEKWGRLFTAQPIAQPENDLVKLSDLFRISRGLATGANSFFILTPQQAQEYQLPWEFLTPILPSPRSLPTNVVEADEHGLPMLDTPLYLLDCRLSEAQVRTGHPTLWRYLESGVRGGLDKRYLCKNRRPWYSQERRPPAPLLCTYMGRQRMGVGRPFRFILNHSRATAPNVYLMLYPKPNLESIMAGKPELLELVWQTLNDIPVETLIGEGRVYGGGLHKIEPHELAKSLARGVAAAIAVHDSFPVNGLLDGTR